MWECYVSTCVARLLGSSPPPQRRPVPDHFLYFFFHSFRCRHTSPEILSINQWIGRAKIQIQHLGGIQNHIGLFFWKISISKNFIKLDWNLPDTSFYGDFLVLIVLKIELDLTKTCQRHEIMFWIAKNATFLNTSLIAKNNKFRHFQVKFPPFKAKTRFENAETRFENSKTRYFTLIIRVDYSRMVLKKPSYKSGPRYGSMLTTKPATQYMV